MRANRDVRPVSRGSRLDISLEHAVKASFKARAIFANSQCSAYICSK